VLLDLADHADEARASAEAWLALARRRGWRLGAAFGSLAGAIIALRGGAIADAVAGAREALAAEDAFWLVPLAGAFLVEALVQRDELELAYAELAGWGLDGELAVSWPTIALRLARGRLHAAAGDHERAVADLLDTGDLAEAAGIRNPAMHPWRSSAAVSLAALGRAAEARRLADDELELARRWGAPRTTGTALRVAGVVRGDRELLAEAAATLAAAPASLERARALVDLGAAARRDRERIEAREHLREGLDRAHRLGGMALAARAREELRVAGARPRRDALRGRDALTPSELRVARLAAEGQSNRQIAQALFVTMRTVELHLTSTYAKLGTTRDGLAAALEERTAEPAAQRTR
jgi:ATP/maltotriose-dependent transcriptional regulator MalT